MACIFDVVGFSVISMNQGRVRKWGDLSQMGFIRGLYRLPFACSTMGTAPFLPPGWRGPVSIGFSTPPFV